MLGTTLLALALLCVAPAAAFAGPWSWSQPSIRFAQKNGLLTKSVTRRGPAAPVSRKAFVRALAALEAYRAAHQQAAAQLPAAPGATLGDVGSGSVYAKAVTLNWASPYGTTFSGGKRITGDEAARGVIGALGLQGSASLFAERLRAEVPGAGTDYYLRAVQVYVRVLDMRYNHPTGQERFEVGPGEAMKVGHVAYMLHKAATAQDWRLGSLTAYETLDLPDLGPNQLQVLRTGVQQLGQPYVWAGETEGSQPEGHGGFDCSGFVWRTMLNGGVPASARRPLAERTSMAMSNIKKRTRKSARSLRPGDLMFWGYRGRKSRPADNFHAGVYMGNGWFIHSSGGNAGPNIDRLDGWWGERFSWGRRILRTA